MLLLVDKPSKVSSFGCIGRLKKIFPWQKIWHAWTLDPLATWILLVGVWKSTKLLWDYVWLDKKYVAEIDLSEITDTWDSDYRDFNQKFELVIKDWKQWIVKDDKILLEPSIEEINIVLNQILSENLFPLPPFSAKKIWWKKRYDLARKWDAEIVMSPMNFKDIKILSYDFPLLKVETLVWSGSYIRSLAYLLWQRLNIWWIIKSLRRTEVWKYKIWLECKSDLVNNIIWYEEILN